MAIQIVGTTVIDNSRNLSNIANASASATPNTYVIRDANGNINATNIPANMQVFTSPGTFTVPSTTTRLKVTVTGGGGAFYSLLEMGGAAGGTGIAVITVTGGSSIPVTVGSAGVPGTPPTPGGNSTFGTFVTGGGAGDGFNAGGDVTFPAPAPSYQAKLSLFGGGGQENDEATSADAYLGAASYWGGSNASPAARSSYGAGGGRSTIPFGSTSSPAGAGVVVVEW